MSRPSERFGALGFDFKLTHYRKLGVGWRDDHAGATRRTARHSDAHADRRERRLKTCAPAPSATHRKCGAALMSWRG